MKKNLNSINIKILTTFLMSNFIAYILLLAIPAKSIENNLLFVSLINVTFITLILIFSILTYIIYPRSDLQIKRKSISFRHLNKNILFLSYAPIVGIVLMAYDRIVLRGINYSEGLRAARYEWLGTSGGSFFGVFGNLLVSFSYIGIFFLILHLDRISKKKQFFLILGIIIGVFGHAALNGGRSNVLLALVMLIVSFLVRNRETNFINFKINKQKILFIIVSFFSMYYIFSIIKSSVSLGNTDLKTLVYFGVDAMYGKVDNDFFSTEYNEFTLLLIYCVSYLYHGQWTAQVSFTLNNPEGNYTFSSAVTYLLERFGVLEPSLNGYFSNTGAFLSLPGAFYYDFGFLGVVILSIFLGMMLGMVFIIIKKCKFIGAFQIIFIVSILYIVLMSPILPAYGLSYFNFIIFAFILLSGVNIIFFRTRLNYLN